MEVVSEGDRTHEKFEFYAKTGTRELLVINRDPWTLELHRPGNNGLELVGTSTPDNQTELTSDMIPLSFRLQPGDERPQIAVAHRDGEQSWLV